MTHGSLFSQSVYQYVELIKFESNKVTNNDMLTWRERLVLNYYGMEDFTSLIYEV